MSLTKQQELFCQHYVDTLSGTKAARLSGYDGARPDAWAYDNLSKSEISGRVAELTSLAIGDEDQFKSEIILHLKKILKASVLEFVEITLDDKGVPSIRLNEDIDDSAIQEIAATNTGLRVKTYSKLDAIAQLMKYYKMIKELGTADNPHHHTHKRMDEVATEALTELDALP